MAAGFVLVFEGLVFALAPSRLEEFLRILSDLPIEARRLLGLVAIAGGTVLVWAAKLLTGG